MVHFRSQRGSAPVCEQYHSTGLYQTPAKLHFSAHLTAMYGDICRARWAERCILLYLFFPTRHLIIFIRHIIFPIRHINFLTRHLIFLARVLRYPLTLTVSSTSHICTPASKKGCGRSSTTTFRSIKIVLSLSAKHRASRQ